MLYSVIWPYCPCRFGNLYHASPLDRETGITSGNIALQMQSTQKFILAKSSSIKEGLGKFRVLWNVFFLKSIREVLKTMSNIQDRAFSKND